ncbi:MAG: hypothetical protein LH645_02205 [Actinomycetia bacterium]|nr:hypothetical protein [Actinomycetes bacterium]
MDSSTASPGTVSIAEQVDRLLDAAPLATQLGDDVLRDELVAREQAAQMVLASPGTVDGGDGTPGAGNRPS